MGYGGQEWGSINWNPQGKTEFRKTCLLQVIIGRKKIPQIVREGGRALNPQVPPTRLRSFSIKPHTECVFSRKLLALEMRERESKKKKELTWTITPVGDQSGHSTARPRQTAERLLK